MERRYVSFLEIAESSIYIKSIELVSAQKLFAVHSINQFFSVPKSLSKKVVLQIFPVHDQEALQLLQKTWIQKIWERQPIGNQSTLKFSIIFPYLDFNLQ